MNEGEQAEYYRRLRADVELALLATSAKFSRVVNGVTREERMHDQARRVALLICAMSLGEGEDGWWVSEQRLIAEALEMDPSDCARAVGRMEEWGVLVVESREGGLWYQLRIAKIALSERAMRANAAFKKLKAERERQRRQLVLVPRPLHEGIGPQVVAMLDENAAPPATVSPVGRVPSAPADDGERPHRKWGESPLGPAPVGSVPSGPVPRNASARGDLPIRYQSQISDSASDGSEGGSLRTAGPVFRDSEKQWLAETLLPLVDEETRELPAEKRELSRRTWLGRIRDEPVAVREALGEVREEMARGRKVPRVLGRVFVKARAIAQASGRVLRMIF